jgi:hypothetical protein
MAHNSEASFARALVTLAAAAQAVFWCSTLAIPRHGLLPFDFIFLWLVLPALILGTWGQSLPLGAGLAGAAFIINLGFFAQL